MPAPTPPAALVIPPVWCPFAVVVHPGLDDAEEDLLRWAAQYDLVRSPRALDHFAASRFGAFAAYTYPHAVDLPLAARWNAYNWFVDDALDEAGSGDDEAVALAREVLAHMPADTPLGSTPSARTPLIRALDDLWAATLAVSSPSWRRRYAGHYRDWMRWSILHRRLVLAGPPVEEPAAMARRRRLHSGVEMSVDLNELSDHRELPDDLVQSQWYQELRIAANNVISWTNDVYSLAKEVRFGDFGSLPGALNAAGMSWRDSLTRTVAMIAEATRDFVACVDEATQAAVLNPAGPEDMDYAVTTLELWIAGSLRWHTESGRYAVRGHGHTAVPNFEPHLVQPAAATQPGGTSAGRQGSR